MATFIRKHTTQVENEDGSISIKERSHTAAELKEIRANDPSRFITVPESHAAAVIRPQMRYQEVEDEVEGDVRGHAQQQPAQRSKRRGSNKGRSASSSTKPTTTDEGGQSDA